MIFLNIKHRNHIGSRTYFNFLGNATLYHFPFLLSLCTCFSPLWQRAVTTLLHSSTELLDTGLSPIIVLLARAFSWERSSEYQSLLSRSRTVHPGPCFLGSRNSEHHHTLLIVLQLSECHSALQKNIISINPRKRFQVNGLQLDNNTSQHSCMRAVRFEKNTPLLSSSYSCLGLWISF